MNNFGKGTLLGIFIGGVAGSVASLIFTKRKYEKINREEVESVKAAFRKKYDGKGQLEGKTLDAAKNVIKAVKSDEENKTNNESDEYAKVSQNGSECVRKAFCEGVDAIEKKPGYTEYAKHSKSTNLTIDTGSLDMGKVEQNTGKEVISNIDFDEDLGYDKITLTYYTGDDTLVDGDDVLDIENFIGRESLNHFGEFMDDELFVRNHEINCDYEIIKEFGCWVTDSGDIRMKYESPNE